MVHFSSPKTFDYINLVLHNFDWKISFEEVSKKQDQNVGLSVILETETSECANDAENVTIEKSDHESQSLEGFQVNDEVLLWKKHHNDMLCLVNSNVILSQEVLSQAENAIKFLVRLRGERLALMIEKIETAHESFSIFAESSENLFEDLIARHR